MAQFEVVDVGGNAGSKEVADKARSSLSTLAFDKESGKNVANGGKTAESATSAAVEGAAASVGEQATSGRELAEQGTKAHEKRQMLEQLGEGVSHGSDGLAKKIMSDRYIKWPPKITEQDRADAKEQLASQINNITDEKDAARLKALQSSLIDGDLEGMKKALGAIAGDPKFDAFLKDLNAQLKDSGAGVELLADGKGNVLVMNKYGETAVSINPKTGETTLRSVERQSDGSVVLKPGEIINKNAGEVMKDVGDTATRNLTHRFDYIKPIHPIHPIHPYEKIKPLGDKPHKTLKEAMDEIINNPDKQKSK